MVDETPTLARVITDAIGAKLADTHTAMPGIIEEYDAATGKASVQPALKRTYETGEVVNLPIINDCPVMFPRGKNFSLTYPLVKGDSCLIIFSERSIDSWLVQGGLNDPNDTRKHDISDGIIIPGLFDFSVPAEADAENVILKNDKLKIILLPDGKISISDGSVELISLISDIADECSKILTNTLLGPQAPINAAAFIAIKADIDKLKE